MSSEVSERARELLPCPLCRREPKVSKDGGPGTMRETEWHIACYGAGYPGPYHKVHVYVRGQNRDAAIAAWNTRSALSAPPHAEDAVEAVARALYEVSAEPEHGDSWERIASKPWGDNFRAHARAAISAYEQAALSAPPIDDEVTQADRDAAKEWADDAMFGLTDSELGKLAQAFRRHRIAAAGEVRRRTIEALRPFASEAEAIPEDMLDSDEWAAATVGDWRRANKLYRSLSAERY